MEREAELPVPPRLLTEAETQAEFEALQRKLVPLWTSIQTITDDPQTIVVVPSISVEVAIDGALQQAYEERYLFLLLLLRQPRARLIYVTSQAIHEEVVSYYLDLLPGVLASHARRRLMLVSPLDGSPGPLTRKLLARPRLIERIRALIPDTSRAHLVPFTTTTAERDLAVALGIPMYGADPRTFHLGTKSGARRIFAEEGVSHPLGVEDLRTPDAIASAVLDIRRRRPEVRAVVVKLNEGVSGEGNVSVDLTDAPAPGGTGERDAIRRRIDVMRFDQAGTSADVYFEKLASRGGIVEERITGRDLRSPSAQLRITPLGHVELLSTHDQVLGGPGGQAYLGCRFPADEGYAATIMREAAKVGRRLAAEGVLGRFAIDFVTVRNARDEWESYAIEINLRKGGTTHPFLTLQFLTDGTYDAQSGVFTTPRGEQKCFVASDHLESPIYRVFTPEDLFDLAARHGLHFDQARQQGVVFHMLSALGEHGRLGVTAVGNTHGAAQDYYDQAVTAMDAEARVARLV